MAALWWEDLEDMSNELNRFATFVNWPHAFPTPTMLVGAGFYYAERHDTTRCFVCQGEVESWTREMVPGKVHRERFANCPFAASENAPTRPPSTHMRVAGNGDGWETQPAGDKHPEYSRMNDRMLSFITWNPMTNRPKPIHLAAAGFVYEGPDDNVKCYSCGGMLRAWEPGDDPWIEHARWFPTCNHVLVYKGREFVDAAAEFHSVEVGIAAYPAEDQCLVCKDDIVSMEFQPCGHRCTCQLCAKAVLICPSCRLEIELTFNFSRGCMCG